MKIPNYKLKWVTLVISIITVSLWYYSCTQKQEKKDNQPGVSVMLVDTDHPLGEIDKKIYGHFLEHINHSVVDGLFAEQIQGRGFEGNDFEKYWKIIGNINNVGIAEENSINGEKCVQLQVNKNIAGIKQDRVFIQEGYNYDGSVWINPIKGSLQILFRVKNSSGNLIAELPLETSGLKWQEVGYSFSSSETDTQASIEIVANGDGTVLLDYISLMRTDVRENGMLRPDLFQALQDLKPPFIRWPGGSFASIYKWKDGIGPHVSRKYHPNEIWGGYSDYYGFGTHEFMELCQQLGSEPMIVLSATNTNPEQVQYAMEWAHYLLDLPTTEWGKMRAANGHPEPFQVKYFQIDNEPMNHGLTPDQYAEIVNVYGSRLRKIAQNTKIVACGQKRSNDMIWSQRVIDIAGDNFDILGCHNYEYENENFQTGLQRIQDYLIKLRDYVRASKHPDIKIALLEWGLCRTYDWQAGLHTAGSLIMYEKLGPELNMSCPALLMRNNSDDPTWTAFIYHDHISWFPGSGYVVEKLFREHYAEKYFASIQGTFRNIENRITFFDDISQMKPEDWKPGTIDAIATGSADGKHIVIKAVNYEGNNNILLVRLQGSTVPEKAHIKIYTICNEINDIPSIEEPDKIKPVESSISFTKDMKIEMLPHCVTVIDIIKE